MRFLPSRVTHSSWVLLLVWVNFLHFWYLKMRFFRDVQPAVQGNILLYEFILCILVSWKSDFCGVMKHMVQFLAGHKTRRFMGTWQSRAHFLHFGSLIFSIFGESLNRRFKGTYFLVAHFMHFGGLKCYFYRVWRMCEPFVGILGTSE